MNWTRYFRFTKNSIQKNLSYRANVLLYLFGNLVQTLVLYYLWKAIFDSAGGGTLNGFNFNQMVAYLLATVAVQSVINGNAEEIIAEEIMEGSIAFNLARPIEYRARVFFDHLGVSLYNLFAAGIPALVVALIVTRDSAGAVLERALAFSVSLVLSFVLVFFYKFCLGLIAFITTNMWGVLNVEAVVSGFLSGALIPIAFFPEWARGVAGIMPFASMVSAPALTFTGRLAGSDLAYVIGIQIAWVLFFAGLSSLAWSTLSRRLAVNGG